MADNNRKPVALTVFDVMSNWLFAAPVQGSSKRPNFRIKILGNVPRITVKTGVEGDKQFGKIDFNTDLATFIVIMNKLKGMADGTDQSDGYMFDYEDDFLAGKKLDAKIVISTVKIGREKDTGRIYIAVLSGDKSRPRIQFFFGPSKYHNIRRADGSPITPKEMSEAYAIGFLEPACALAYEYLVNNFDPEAKNVPKPMGEQGGGGGGGYNQNRGGGNGYNGGGNGGGGYGGGQQRQSAPVDNFDLDVPDF